MDNSKKTKVFTAILVCLVIGMAVSLYQIYNLNEEFDRKSRNISNEISSLRGEIDSIYANVDNSLKKQASLLSGSEYTIGEFDAEKQTMSVTFSVIPKSVTDTMRVYIDAGGEKTELTKNGEEYTGVKDVGLFVQYDEWPVLTIVDGEKTQTEILEDVHISRLYERVLPQLCADMTGTSHFDDGLVRVEAGFSVENIEKNDSDVKFESFTYIREKNGAVEEKKDITDEVIKADGSYHSRFVQTFEAAVGDEIELYVIAKDSLGYIHKCRVSYWYRESDDEEDTPVISTGSELIYDKNGVLLFGEEM